MSTIHRFSDTLSMCQQLIRFLGLRCNAAWHQSDAPLNEENWHQLHEESAHARGLIRAIVGVERGSTGCPQPVGRSRKKHQDKMTVLPAALRPVENIYDDELKAAKASLDFRGILRYASVKSASIFDGPLVIQSG